MFILCRHLCQIQGRYVSEFSFWRPLGLKSDTDQKMIRNKLGIASESINNSASAICVFNIFEMSDF